MKTLRDSQRAKLYAWERKAVVGYLTSPELTLDECRALVEEAYRRFGLTLYPRVIAPDHGGRRYARGGASTVLLPRWARRVAVVLHEAAHGITERLAQRHGIPDPAAHGPEFVRVFVSLLEAWKIPTTEPGLALASQARKAKLKVAAPGGWVPMPLRQYKAWREAVAKRVELQRQLAEVEKQVEATAVSYRKASIAAFREAKEAKAARVARGKARAAELPPRVQSEQP
jgi:hypothetical protein